VMSMISRQCDELRDKAKLLRMLAKGLEAPYVVPSTKQLMAMAMYDSATRMEGAADTIRELREKFSGTVDERERVWELQTESDSLRDLAYEMWEWMGRARHDGAIRCDEMDEIGRRAVGLGLLAHELGIEADSQD